MALAAEFLARVCGTHAMLHIGCSLPEAMFAALDAYLAHGERQIDRIRRRVQRRERNPHAEKLFSIFETHTEATTSIPWPRLIIAYYPSPKESSSPKSRQDRAAGCSCL